MLQQLIFCANIITRFRPRGRDRPIVTCSRNSKTPIESLHEVQHGAPNISYGHKSVDIPNSDLGSSRDRCCCAGFSWVLHVHVEAVLHRWDPTDVCAHFEFLILLVTFSWLYVVRVLRNIEIWDLIARRGFLCSRSLQTCLEKQMFVRLIIFVQIWQFLSHSDTKIFWVFMPN